MPDTTASACLGDALDFMTPTNWTKGVEGRDVRGDVVGASDPEAIEHCALGYINRLGYIDRHAINATGHARFNACLRNRAVGFLAAALKEMGEVIESEGLSDRTLVAMYNDANDTTFEDIVLLFKRAYEAALDAGD